MPWREALPETHLFFPSELNNLTEFQFNIHTAVILTGLGREMEGRVAFIVWLVDIHTW
jgi:hypothetical protein